MVKASIINVSKLNTSDDSISYLNIQYSRSVPKYGALKEVNAILNTINSLYEISRSFMCSENSLSLYDTSAIISDSFNFFELSSLDCPVQEKHVSELEIKCSLLVPSDEIKSLEDALLGRIEKKEYPYAPTPKKKHFIDKKKRLNRMAKALSGLNN